MDANQPYSLKQKRIWVAGHLGLIGSALVRRLQSEDCTILTATRSEVDLTRQSNVENWMTRAKPDAIFIATAKVGGIQANSTQPVPFLYDNMMIAANILQQAYVQGVEKVLFLGSSCIYPKLTPQPMSENQLYRPAGANQSVVRPL